VTLGWRPISSYPIWSCDDLGIACHILHYANIIGWFLLLSLSLSIYRPYYSHLFSSGGTTIHSEQVMKLLYSVRERSLIASLRKIETQCPVKLQHPTLTSILLILWSVPTLTIDRFLLATSFTLYLLCMNSVTQQDYEQFRSTIIKSNPTLFANGVLSKQS